MSISKLDDLEKINLITQARLITLLGLAFLIPFYFNMQWFAGPVVNAILIIILFLSGRMTAFAAAFIPSLSAIAGGLLPPIMLPFVPLIITGNIFFITVIDHIYNKNKDGFQGYWQGLAAGSWVKFIFLFVAIHLLGPLFVKNELLLKIINAFSWPQLISALGGGVIAWVFLKWLKRF